MVINVSRSAFNVNHTHRTSFLDHMLVFVLSKWLAFPQNKRPTRENCLCQRQLQTKLDDEWYFILEPLWSCQDFVYKLFSSKRRDTFSLSIGYLKRRNDLSWGLCLEKAVLILLSLSGYFSLGYDKNFSARKLRIREEIPRKVVPEEVKCRSLDPMWRIPFIRPARLRISTNLSTNGTTLRSQR